MDMYLIIGWLLLAVITPPIILWLGYTGYRRYSEVWKLLLRLTIALMGYAISTFLAFLWMAGLFAMGGAHVKRTGNESSQALIVVVVYLLCGWICGSIANGRMVRSFADFKPAKESL